MATREKIVEVKQLSYAYQNGKNRNVVFDDLDLTIYKNEIVAILGPSGSGKSTLASLLAGHIVTQSGGIRIDGTQHAAPGRHCIVIHQAHDIFDWLTVGQNMAIVGSDRIDYYLQMVGLYEHKDKRGDQLSGGMKKRLSFARALSVNPRFIILDEAFSSLDYQLRYTLYKELLAITHKEKKTLLLITHDIEEAVHLADRIVVFGGKPTAPVFEADVRSLRVQFSGDFTQSGSYHKLINSLKGKLGI